MGLTFNNNKRHKIIKGNSREKLFISINCNTNILAYWRKQNPGSTRFFVTNRISSKYTDIQSSYNFTSDHSPIIAALRTSVIVRQPTPHLHRSKTNWNTYRQIIQDKVNLSIKLKKHNNIDLETNNLFIWLQHAVKEATPNSNPQRTTNNISYEINRLVAEKRRARSICQRTHTPDSRRICNWTSNKLKSKLQEMRNESFEKYVSNLKREDNYLETYKK
jgi:hypothetical protein